MSDKTNLTELNEFFIDMNTLQPVGIQFNRNFKNRKLVTQFYTFNNRKVWIEKDGKEWVGGFDDDSGMEFIAKTKKKLLWELQSEA